MRSLKAFAIAVALFLLISPAALAQIRNSVPPEYDAVRDFSLVSNPNGVWSYGSLTKFGDPLTLYTVTCTNLFGLPDSVWATQGCNTPYVLHNDSSQQICFESICVPPNYLQLDVGNRGFGPFISVVRWTAPQSGTFTFYVSVEGLDWDGPTSTDFRVIYNSNRELLKVVVNSYESPYHVGHTLAVAAGDTMDFAVDEGLDGDYHFDSTGIEIKVYQVQ